MFIKNTPSIDCTNLTLIGVFTAKINPLQGALGTVFPPPMRGQSQRDQLPNSPETKTTARWHLSCCSPAPLPSASEFGKFLWKYCFEWFYVSPLSFLTNYIFFQFSCKNKHLRKTLHFWYHFNIHIFSNLRI